MCYIICIRSSLSAASQLSMANKKSEFVSLVLEFLEDVAQLVPRPLESPYAHVKRLRKLTYKEYYDAMYHLHRRGVVRIQKQDGKNFIQLTEKGALETLFEHAGIEKQNVWDKKWRILTFDIPEDAHLERDRLRSLLKRNNFYKLQASVFIHPFPLNKKAIRYLLEAGLSRYIRIMRVEEMDFDGDLKKHFSLR